MFGYVKPYVAELKVGEYEKYRALYCGLCRSIGNVTGQLSRFSLSYDLTFLAATRMAVCGITPEFEEHRCLAHVTKKRLIMRDNDALSYTAAISAVLRSAKLDDDISDEHGLKRLAACSVSPFVRNMVRLTEKIVPSEVSAETSRLLFELTELERNACDSANLTADAFGRVLEFVFAYGLTGEEAKLCGEIGRFIGRFIYICDAACDMESDIKKGRYNPIALGFGSLATEDGKMSDIVRNSIMTASPVELEALGEAVDRLPREHVLTPIIRNIVYLGLPAVLEKILRGEQKINERVGI